MKHRLIVVPIIRGPDCRYLLIKMSPHRGVFPGQWGLPGGGVEDGETIEDALRVFLIYRCTTDDVDPVLNEEFDAFAWAAPGDLASYDLNVATVATLRQTGIMTG
jgi:nucleoside triphosphatase